MIRATASDKPLVLDILSASFDDNKSVNAVVRQDRHRLQRIRALMDYSYNYCNAFGEVWLSGNRQACAMLMFPDQKLSQIQTIGWDLKLAIKVIGITRIRSVLEREAKIKSNHPSTPFAYLWFIGVSPGAQGKDVGSNFLREIITECERKKRQIYLETSVERNLSFYTKAGFEIYGKLHFGYPLYLLRR